MHDPRGAQIIEKVNLYAARELANTRLPFKKKEVRRGAVFKTLVSPKKQNLQRDTKFRTRVQNEGLKNEGPKRGSNEGPKRGSQKRGSKTRVQNEVQEQKTRVKRGSTEKRPSFLKLISGRDLVGTLIENCTFGNQKKSQSDPRLILTDSIFQITKLPA